MPSSKYREILHIAVERGRITVEQADMVYERKEYFYPAAKKLVELGYLNRERLPEFYRPLKYGYTPTDRAKQEVNKIMDMS